MKASEVLDKLKDVFLSSEDEVTETPIEEVKEELSSETVSEEIEKEEVDLASEEVADEEVKEETTELAEEVTEEVAEEETEESTPDYVTREELQAMKNEFLEILEGLVKKEQEQTKEVPQELSTQEEVEEISHSPESNVEAKKHFTIGANRPQTTKDRVFARMFK